MRLRPAPIASALKRLLGTRRLRIETPHGIFWIDPLSLSGYVLSRTGQYEPDMERTFAEFLKPGSKFVDLGANEGYFTVLGAKICGPRGRVVAVEPQDRLLPVIEENLRLNGLEWVHVVQAAVSDKSGTATIHLSADVNCGGSRWPIRHRPDVHPTTLLPPPLRLVGTNIAKLNKQITGADIWAGPTRCPMLTTTFASSPLICCAAHNPIRRRQSFAHDIKKNWSGEIICFYARVRQLIPIQKHTLVVVEFAYVFRAEDGK